MKEAEKNDCVDDAADFLHYNSWHSSSSVKSPSITAFSVLV
jgi:hypothetical protein